MVIMMFIILFFIPVTDAAENDYGSVYAWVKIREGEWENATVHEILKIHELFAVKVTITAKINCDIIPKIYGPGKTVTYEVIEGPSRYSESLFNLDCSKGWTKTYEWKMRSTENWSDGVAPLNLRVEFIKNLYDNEGNFYDYDSKKTDFTLLAAYIEPEEWNISTDTVSTNTIVHTEIYLEENTPGFEMIGLLLLVYLFALFRKKQRK